MQVDVVSLAVLSHSRRASDYRLSAVEARDAQHADREHPTSTPIVSGVWA